MKLNTSTVKWICVIVNKIEMKCQLPQLWINSINNISYWSYKDSWIYGLAVFIHAVIYNLNFSWTTSTWRNVWNKGQWLPCRRSGMNTFWRWSLTSWNSRPGWSPSWTSCLRRWREITHPAWRNLWVCHNMSSCYPEKTMVWRPWRVKCWQDHQKFLKYLHFEGSCPILASQATGLKREVCIVKVDNNVCCTIKFVIVMQHFFNCKTVANITYNPRYFSYNFSQKETKYVQVN